MTNLVLILNREDRCFERGVREAIHVHIENPSLSRDGDLRYNRSLISRGALFSMMHALG